MLKFIKAVTSVVSRVTDQEIAQAHSGLMGSNSEHDQLGALPPGLIRLYAVSVRYVAQAKAAESELEAMTTKMACSASTSEVIPLSVLHEAEKKLRECTARSNAVHRMFSASVREELGIWDVKNVVVSQGWQVATPDKFCEQCGRRHSQEELNSLDGIDMDKALGMIVLDLGPAPFGKAFAAKA